MGRPAAKQWPMHKTDEAETYFEFNLTDTPTWQLSRSDFGWVSLQIGRTGTLLSRTAIDASRLNHNRAHGRTCRKAMADAQNR